MKNYIGVVYKYEDCDYNVVFPDFLGCVTGGKTLDEAYEMAVEALNFHIEGMLEDGDKMPKRSSLEEAIKNSPEDDLPMAHFLVPVTDIHIEKPVRINATFKPSLLSAIDKAVAKRKTTRSGWLAEIASKELGLTEHLN